MKEWMQHGKIEERLREGQGGRDNLGYTTKEGCWVVRTQIQNDDMEERSEE